MQSDGIQPLSGIRVIDFSQVMLGPSATQVLADYGADVIKIERPGAGDLSRSSIPDDPDGPNNPVFRSLNRNKRSIALDLRQDEGKQVVYELVRGADIVVNNFRAGVMERMGFGYARLAEINPRIICAFGSGFGQAGPLAYKGGQDILAQALSGVMMRKCNDDEPLTIYATSLCDYSAGMHLVQAILLALLQREKTGRGQQVSVSLFESMLAMQMQEAAMILMRDQEVNWAAMPLSGVFECADHPLVLVGAFKANPLRDICAALELPDLSLEARFANLEQQFAHKAELQGLLRARFRTQPRDHWLARLEAEDLLCAPVRDMREVLVDPQTVHNAMLMEGPAAGGTHYRFIASPITMSAAPVTLNRVPPRLGEHTDEVLAEAAASATRGRS